MLCRGVFGDLFVCFSMQLLRVIRAIILGKRKKPKPTLYWELFSTQILRMKHRARWNDLLTYFPLFVHKFKQKKSVYFPILSAFFTEIFEKGI